MVKYIFGLLFLGLVILIEAAVLRPNLLLVIILALQFLGFTKESYFGAFFGGILFNLLVSGLFGLGSFVLLLLSGFVGLIKQVAEGSPLVLLLSTFVASVIFQVVQAFPVFNSLALCKGGILDVLVMVVVYPTLRYLSRGVFGREELKVGIT